MITTHLPLGDVRFSAEYFSTLVGEAAKNCYGVAAMAPHGVADKVKSLVRREDFAGNGVGITTEPGRLVTRIHTACG